MRIISNEEQFFLEEDNAVAIGKFDGIHLGHRKLLREIIGCKERGLKACVFTFDKAPGTLFGGGASKELMSAREKRLYFERLGVDIVVEFPLNRKTAAMPPEVFARNILRDQMRARVLVAGEDLSFGAKGAGDAALLRRMEPEMHCEVRCVEKVCVQGSPVSSTRIRELIEQGRMEEAGNLLGTPYLVLGNVITGNRIGRTIGFPTINIQPAENKLMPPNGVYFSRICVDGRMYSAISNIGYKPTVSADRILGLESYLYDFDGDLYGKTVETYLCRFERAEQRFNDLVALKSQLEHDLSWGRQQQQLIRDNNGIIQ